MSRIELDGASGFLVRADKQVGGIVLLPTIYGVNPFVRDFAQTLAAQGLTTLIWDPYSGDALPQSYDAARTKSAELRDTMSLDAMAICVDHLMSELRIDAVGALGFCLGGRYVLLLGARDPRLAAAVAVYPSIHEPKRPNQDEDVLVRARDISCPVQVIYPGKDHVTSNATFHRLQDGLQQRAAPSSILLYPGADHGFMHEAGAANESADRQSRPQIAAFLAASLAQPR